MVYFVVRIKLGEKQYTDAFNDELEAFRSRIQERARIRIEEAMKEYEEVNNYFINFLFLNKIKFQLENCAQIVL